MNTALPALPPRPDLSQQQLAELAYEVARDLRDLPDILKSFKITEAQFKHHIENQDWFKRVLEAAMIEWTSTGSTRTRIQHQAALALETGIAPLTVRMLAEDTDLAKAVETAKLLAKLAGLDNAGTSGNAGEKFTITINLGADNQLKIEKDIAPGPAIEAPAGPAEILENTKGSGDP